MTVFATKNSNKYNKFTSEKTPNRLKHLFEWVWIEMLSQIKGKIANSKPFMIYSMYSPFKQGYR